MSENHIEGQFHLPSSCVFKAGKYISVCWHCSNFLVGSYHHVFMAFRSGQNYFKSTSNSQTLYQHVITLNIMLKISR